MFADKLNRAQGPVRVLIPMRGWSSVDAPGNPTHDPREDKVFVNELLARLRPEIMVSEVDANMEDPAFGEAVIKPTLAIFTRSFA